ncbi:MAG: hypothetical protein KKI08_11935 [Armatimonadetes bacterium]|nr:hypothetical protein [Armatimonadota bacterium]
MRQAGLVKGVCLGVVASVLGLASPLMALPGDHTIMQRVLAKFVEQTGYPMMGVGSWIKGVGFDPAKSDFDMRLVWPGGGSQAQQLAHWQKARTQMARLIREEFGDRAGNILSRTNLYAPNQLMHGVENSADALARFQQLNTAPNLAHSGPVTESTAGKFTEGLYGSGSQTYVQGYERGAGRLFYNNNGKCVTGLSELAHMGEGMPKYTALGTANTAGQWAEHGLDALRKGSGKDVIKYLERLERDLVKSQSLCGLDVDDVFRQRLRNMRQLVKDSGGKLAGLSDDAARLLLQAQAKAAMLKGYQTGGPMRQAYYRVMMDAVTAKNKLGDLIGKVMAKTPSWVNAERAMGFIAVCFATPGIAQKLARDENPFETMSTVSGALGTGAAAFSAYSVLGPALLGEVMAEIIVQARANGFDMAAGFQGAWDLMEGIYSSWGRADVDPDPRLKLTLADMVANYKDESKLEARVYQHCLRASTRGLGAANAQHDQGVADAIFAKCWPIIRDAWRWERDNLTTEYLMVRSEVLHCPLVIYYKPTAPQPGKQVICEAISADKKLGERLERMRQILRILYGRGSGLAVNYYWTPAGVSVGDRDWQRGFTFSEKGTYPVKVRLDIAPFAKHPKTEHRVMLRRQIEALVEIEVGGEKKDKPLAGICPQCGKPLGSSPNCFYCILHRHDPTKEGTQR